MKNIKILVLILTLSGCAYKPVVDSRGLKGTEVAYRYTDDLETCKSIAKKILIISSRLTKRFTTITLDQLLCGYLTKWNSNTSL